MLSLEHVTKVVATTIHSSDFLGDLGLLGFLGIRIQVNHVDIAPMACFS